jgi:hypothetical protein
MQLSQPEFQQFGGGDIHDPKDNINAGVAKLAADRDWFNRTYGRDPNSAELYLTHQQGRGGLSAHMANPDAPAWQNVASTAEGRAKGAEWSKNAVWGNVPADARDNYPGGVEGMTSRQFMDLWNNKVGGGATFDDLLGQYRSHVDGMRQRYGANTQPSTPTAPQPSAVDPRAAMLLQMTQPRQPAPPMANGMPNYSGSSPPSYSPQTMNYLRMMLATQPQGAVT